MRKRDPYKEFCNFLRGNVAPSMHKLFCQPADGRTCCARLPAKCLAIRRQQSGYVPSFLIWGSLFDTQSTVLDVLGRLGGSLTSKYILPYIHTRALHVHLLAMNFQPSNTLPMQKSKHSACFDI